MSLPVFSVPLFRAFSVCELPKDETREETLRQIDDSRGQSESRTLGDERSTVDGRDERSAVFCPACFNDLKIRRTWRRHGGSAGLLPERTIRVPVQCSTNIIFDSCHVSEQTSALVLKFAHGVALCVGETRPRLSSQDPQSQASHVVPSVKSELGPSFCTRLYSLNSQILETHLWVPVHIHKVSALI